MIFSPVLYFPGYPFDASTTPTADLELVSKILLLLLSRHDSIKSIMSYSNEGKTTWVSGSPNLQLNSITKIPFFVNIRPQ